MSDGNLREWVGLDVGGRMEGESNKRDVSMEMHFWAREKPGTGETLRNPQLRPLAMEERVT